ncbi:MAG: hypothetical protein K5664_03530 [Firmicutes bacterium]|nr:hypothetical protein [Bacillota bacterium]HAL63145.1 hypothetical protein [Clostridiales bacterium]
MNVQNAMAAKIMGEVLANGMSLSDINLAESINSAAANTLESIRNIISDEKKDEKQKVREVKNLIKKQGIY